MSVLPCPGFSFILLHVQVSAGWREMKVSCTSAIPHVPLYLIETSVSMGPGVSFITPTRLRPAHTTMAHAIRTTFNGTDINALMQTRTTERLRESTRTVLPDSLRINNLFAHDTLGNSRLALFTGQHGRIELGTDYQTVVFPGMHPNEYELMLGVLDYMRQACCEWLQQGGMVAVQGIGHRLNYCAYLPSETTTH